MGRRRAVGRCGKEGPKARDLRSMWVVVSSLLMAAGAGSAQQAPPEVAFPEPPSFPNLEDRVLSNGVGVVIVRDTLLSWVEVSLAIPGGRSADLPGLAGVAELVSQLITRGTDSRSPTELASAVDGSGIILSVVVGTDWTTVSLGSLTMHLDSALTLLADVVLHQSFPQAELQRVRRQRLVALQTAWTEPRAVAARTLRQAVYGAHPYGLLERPEEVRDLSAADLRDYHRRVFKAEGALFLVSGDVDPDDVANRLEAHFSGWSAGADYSPPAGRGDFEAAVTGSGGAQSLIVHVPGSTRALIRMGHALAAGDHPDWAGLAVLGQMLGGDPEARLGEVLRSRGWTGSATAVLTRRRGPGLLEVDLDVPAEVADSAVAEVMSNVAMLGSEPPGAEETEALTSSISVALPLQLATARQVVGQVGRLRLLAGAPARGPDELEEYAAAVRAQTPEGLRRIAAEHLDPEDLRIVVVGDARLLRPRLAALGPVRMVDMDGADLDLADLAPPVTPLAIDASSLQPGTWRYRISLDGGVAGEMVRRLAPATDGSAGRFSLRSSTTLGPQLLNQEVIFEVREFRPVGGSFEFTQRGQRVGAHLDVVEGRILGARALPDGHTEPFEAPLVPGSLLGEMLEVALWLADLQEGLELVLPVLQVESGVVAHVRVRVLDRTRVTVPAGRYDAYRIEIEGAQAPQLVYARVRAPHVVVRLETPGQPFVIELEAEEVPGGG